MKKYYTRACNFYYGKSAAILIKKKAALSLCGQKDIAFDSIEIFTRDKNKATSKVINLKNINKLNRSEKKKSSKWPKKNHVKKKKFSQKCKVF